MNRIQKINDVEDIAGKSVVYVMSRDQRVKDNHALLAAQAKAIEKQLPLAVLFNLTAGRTKRAREQYMFMLEGLRQVEKYLQTLNIPLIMVINGGCHGGLVGTLQTYDPVAVYLDFSPLKGPTCLRNKIAKQMKCPVYQVDTHNIIPVWVTSEKREYAARTIRPKIHRQLQQWLKEPAAMQTHPISWPGMVATIDQLSAEIDSFVSQIPANGVAQEYQSGESAAAKKLDHFIKNGLSEYGTDRNDPNIPGQSELSVYLHYGQISALRVVLDLGPDASVQFIEELVVRKELSDNYCYYNPEYVNLATAPDWAQNTLDSHRDDKREYVYSLDQLESAHTHDPAWNAAQSQLRHTGKIHGYMRMYWAKKVLEWTESPEQAIQILVYLNDFYSIDGGDPNGYTGIMWSVAGIHDRPWFNRPVYGSIRYMNANGLAKKFDLQKYVDKYSNI
jgi:deoxyribodipyrimidine photo-lyase